MADGGSKTRRGVRRIAIPGAVGLGVAFAVYLIVLSPALLAAVSDTDDDWSFYANVGEAYEGVSAIFSGLALCGVALSLVQQHRQAATNRMAIERQRHYDIVSLGINDPELACGVEPEATQRPHFRQEVYINLRMGYWLTTWQMGEMDDKDVRAVVGRMFKGPIARDWWAYVRPNWSGHSVRAIGRFAAIVTKEWERASAEIGRASETEVKQTT